MNFHRVEDASLELWLPELAAFGAGLIQREFRSSNEFRELLPGKRELNDCRLKTRLKTGRLGLATGSCLKRAWPCSTHHINQRCFGGGPNRTSATKLVSAVVFMVGGSRLPDTVAPVHGEQKVFAVRVNYGRVPLLAII